MLKQLFSGGMLKTLQLVISASVSLFTLPIMIHSLGDYNYSLFSFISSIIAMVCLIDLGFHRSFMQSLSASYGKNDFKSLNTIISIGIIVNLTLITLLLSIVGIIGATGTHWIDKPHNDSLFLFVILLLGGAAAVQFLSRMAGEILITKIRYDLLISGSIVETLVRVGASVWVVTHGYGLIELSAVILSTTIIESVWKFFCAKRVFPEIQLTTKNFSMTTTRSLFNFSFFAFFCETFKTLRIQILPALITSFVSLNAIVFMTVAQRLLDYCYSFFASWIGMIITLFGQLHGKQNQKTMENIIIQGSSMIMIGISYLGLCLYLYAGPFISAWLGSNYQQSTEIVLILAFPICAECLMLLSKEYLFGIAKHQGLAGLHLIELVLMIALAFPLGLKFGLNGIAYSVAIAVTPLEVFGVIWLVSRTTSTSWWTLYRESFKTLFQFAVIAIPVGWFVGPMIQNTFLSIIAFNVVQLLVFAPLIWFLLPDYFQQKLKLKVFAFK